MWGLYRALGPREPGVSSSSSKSGKPQSRQAQGNLRGHWVEAKLKSVGVSHDGSLILLLSSIQAGESHALTSWRDDVTMAMTRMRRAHTDVTLMTAVHFNVEKTFKICLNTS